MAQLTLSVREIIAEVELAKARILEAEREMFSVRADITNTPCSVFEEALNLERKETLTVLQQGCDKLKEMYEMLLDEKFMSILVLRAETHFIENTDSCEVLNG